MRYAVLLTPLAVAATITGCDLDTFRSTPLRPTADLMETMNVSRDDLETTSSGLQRADVEVGTGTEATPGRVVVVHEAPGNLGLGAEVAARVTEECFYSLEAPVLRVAGYDTPYPAARVEEDYLPDLDRVLDAVDRSLGW